MKQLAAVIAGSLFSICLLGGPALADDGNRERMEALEKKVEVLLREIEELKAVQAAKLAEVPTQPQASAKEDGGFLKETASKFSFGGYGEIHANFVDGPSAGDKFDIHRLVAYVGYDFADWIKLQSEIELEHAFVKNTAGGELSVEQLYLDFLLYDYANIRAGRLLAPLGITNRRHEPPTFNGVERPSFDRVIIPSTWSLDGVGLFGNVTDWLRYEAYAVAGLDGSKFSALNGIRDGRIKESPGLNEIAYTGRIDAYPLLNSDLPLGQDLRLGASFYHGGFDNGNNGKNPKKEGDVTIYSGDFEASAWKFDFRGAAALIQVDGAKNLTGVAEEMLGYYLEAGFHFWPEMFKRGKLENSDAVVFARFDDYDTQYKMPSGVAKNPAGDRQEWTVGLNFYPTPNLVVKADYQFLESKAAQKPDNLFNLGVGWMF